MIARSPRMHSPTWTAWFLNATFPTPPWPSTNLCLMPESDRMSSMYCSTVSHRISGHRNGTALTQDLGHTLYPCLLQYLSCRGIGRLADHRCHFFEQRVINANYQDTRGAKNRATKLNCLLQGEDLSVVRIIRKPLLSNFAVSEKHHLHTQAVCTARIGVCSSADNTEMDITRFMQIHYSVS